MNIKNNRNRFSSLFVTIFLLIIVNFTFMVSEYCLDTVEAMSNWTLTSDTDFNSGSLTNISIIGTGSNAELSLDVDQNWVKKQLITEPTKRTGHATASIWGTDKVLLFGGYASTSEDTTWLYDKVNNSWVQLFPKTKPSPRYHHRMCCIFGTDKILLFGGFSAGYRDDTWLYDFSDNNWTEIVPATKPGRRYLQGMAPIYGKTLVVMFGGFYGGNLDNMWLFNLTTGNWTELFPNTKPSGRYQHDMDMIFNDDKVVMFGGTAGTNETWVYDFSANNWTKQNVQDEPEGRMGHAMATLYGTDKVVLFGGAATNFLNDTWIYDVSANNWTNLSTPNSPSARKFTMMSTIYGTDKIMLFGGFDTGDLNETWEFNYLSTINTGYFISPAFEIGMNTTLRTISWNGTNFENSSLKCKIRTALNESELLNKDFLGYDGTPGSFYETSPADIWIGHFGDRWVQYCVYFNSSEKNEIPTLEDLTLSFNHWPVTTLIYPANNAIITINKPTFLWSFDDEDSARQTAFQVIISNNISFDEIVIDSGIQNTTNKQWTFPGNQDYDVIPDDTWFWKVRTKDNDGDWSLFSNKNCVVIDANPPESEITTPLNNSYLNHLSSIDGLAVEHGNGTGIKKIEIIIMRIMDNHYWNGFDWTTDEAWLSASGNNVWHYNSSKVLWTSGEQYLILSRAVDNALNFENIDNKSIYFIFDNNKPSSWINNPVTESFVNNLQVINGSANDMGGSNINYIELNLQRIDNNNSWNNKEWDKKEHWLPVVGTSEWFFNSSNVNWLTDTFYSVKSRAIDLAGNLESPGLNNVFMFDNLPPDNTELKIENNNLYTNSTDVILTINSTDSGSGLSFMSFSANNKDWTHWEVFKETKHFVLSKGDGEKVVYLKVRDRAGNVAESVYDNIILDTNPPENLSIIINQYNIYTSKKSLELALDAKDAMSGINKMSFSFDNLIWTPWEQFDQKRTISFDSTDGEITVYYRVIDNAGNIATALDNIILDTIPPYDLSIVINKGSKVTNSSIVILDLYAKDDISGMDQMSFSSDGIIWSKWEDYQIVKGYTISSGDGIKNIYFRTKDNAGNIAEPVLTSIILNTSSNKVIPNNNKTDDDGDTQSNIFLLNQNLLIISIIIIICCIILISIFLWRRSHLDKKEQISQESLTTKPLPVKVLSFGVSPEQPEYSLTQTSTSPSSSIGLLSQYSNEGQSTVPAQTVSPYQQPIESQQQPGKIAQIYDIPKLPPAEIGQESTITLRPTDQIQPEAKPQVSQHIIEQTETLPVNVSIGPEIFSQPQQQPFEVENLLPEANEPVISQPEFGPEIEQQPQEVEFVHEHEPVEEMVIETTEMENNIEDLHYVDTEVMTELEKLNELKEKGELSDAEYYKRKMDLLK